MTPAAIAFVFLVGVAAGLLIAALLVVRVERGTKYQPPQRVFTAPPKPARPLETEEERHRRLAAIAGLRSDLTRWDRLFDEAGR